MTKKDTRTVILVAAAAILLIVLVWGIGGFQIPTNTSVLPGENTATTSAQNNNTNARTVLNVIAGIEYGSRFSQLLSSTGVGSSLSGRGPYTVFVSTDGAFGRLVPGTVNNLSAAGKKRLMQYHIVSGKKLDVDALKSGEALALSKDMLNFQVTSNNEIFVNSGQVIETYNASNGIVYVINTVLLPPLPTQ